MKKVLWLSNFCFSDDANSGSGTWIEAMGKGLIKRGQYELINVTLGSVVKIARRDACGFEQWVAPIKAVARKPMHELPPEMIVNGIKNVVDDVKPDLIHVWGTERFWGLLTARKILDYPALLEMQGLTSAMVPYITGCLTQEEIRRCFRMKEFLRPELSLQNQQRRYTQSTIVEQEIVSGHRYIDYQSEWIRANIASFVSNAKLFKTRMMLREEFLEAISWKYPKNKHVVFASCGWGANKGLHVLIRACQMLRRRYPDIQLRIAGGFGRGIRRSGYEKWVREILGSELDFTALGALTPNRIVEELEHASVFVNPSMVESYSMSLAEAMAVGCPCIASYAGAMPEVGGGACLYFPLADVGSCANRIMQIFELREQAEELGSMARKRSCEMHDMDMGVERQIEIYEEILNNGK